MSRNNLFELNELSQSQNDLIPEREQKTQEKTGRAVRPKPRPRTVLTGTRHSNDSLEGDGVQNEAFALDEYTISSAGDHDHDFKSNAAAKSSKNDYVDTFPSRLVSSTNPAKANDPLVVFASGDAGADVNANASSTWTTTKFSEKFKVERETKINERGSQRRPKPKPRTKSKEDLLGDDQRDRETGGKSEISARTRPRKSGDDDSEFSEGTSGQSVLESQKLKGGESDEYLVIPVPEAEDNEKDNQLSNYKQSDASAGTGFLGKWKKAIKTFSKEAVSISSRQSSIKRKPRSDDVDVESGAGIEEQSQANQQREESMELTPTQAASARVRTPEKGRKKQSRTKTDAHKISGRSSGSSQTPSPSPRAPAHSKSSESDASPSPSPQHSTQSKLSKRRVQQGEREFSEFLGITIHRSDSLPADPFCTHPVVKVTLMNQDGSYISKRRERISSGRGLRQGGIGRGVETSDSEDEGGRNKRGGRRTRGILSRSKSSASSASTNLSNDAILPMLTQPYQFSSYGHGHSHKHSLSSVSVPVREPAWNELILFDEPFSKFVHEDSTCIFFFEIMDFLPVDHIEKVSGRNRYSGSEMGWHKVAWAFLKPVGANGVRNVNHKLRLQLYKPERLTQREADAGPEVYCWWKFRRLSKLDATTLHVTVKGIAPPSCPTASLQALLAMRKEELTEALIDSQLQTEVKVGADEGSGDDDDDGDGSLKLKHGRSGTAKELVIVPVQEPPEWNRLKGQSCKPPNKLLKALPSSDLDSLKISVSGNVHCVRFSPCGQFLAAGFDTGQMHTVLIFEIPSAVLVKSLRCHHGLIYDLAWRKHFSRDDHVTNYLATASADSTASIWRCRQDRNRSVNVSLVKILLHPSFVYCIRFHSKDPNLVATGCFDRMIRIWSIDSKKGSMDGQETDSSPVIMLDNPASFVNCLEFHPSGKYLFAGDGEGSMHQWKCSSNSQRWSLDRCIKLHEHSNRPINSITIHPTYGNKLLVHSRDSCLKIVDVETFLVLQTFHGFKNERFNIGSTFSPCGNLVLCGSEDSTLCVWDADTSRILQFIKPADADVENAVITCVDYHPHDFYVAIGVLSANSTSVPCPILLYTYEQPPKLQVSTIVKLKNIARTHQKSGGGNMKVSSVSVNENTNSVRDQLKQEILSNQSRSSTPSTNPRSASFAAGGAPQESVDSTDKFMSILSKLDTALKVTNTMLHANAKSEEKPKSQSQSQLESSSPNKIREQKQRLQRPSTGNSQRSTKSTNARERKSPTAAPARTKDQTLSPDRQRYRKEPPPEDDDDDDSFRHNLHEGSGGSQNQQQQQRPRIRTQAEAAASIRVEASQSQTNTAYGNKLLVHSRDSCLKIVDVETFLVLQTFHGFKNERFNIGSTFSPCGNLVLCGSEDSTLCVWDADTSRILQFIKPADADVENAVITCVDYHPHDFYVAIGVLSANSTSVPCPILLYTYEQPPKLQVSTIVKLKNIARTHQKSGGGNMKVSSVSVNENTNSVRDQLKQEILSNQSRSSTPSTNPRSASFAAGGAPQESVDSTDKFMSILSKLDTALKVTNTMLHANAKSEEKPKSQSQSQLESSSPNKIREQKQRLQRPSTGNSQRSTKSTNARERKSPTAAPARTKDQTLSPDRQRYRKEPPPEDDDDDDSFRHNLHEGSGGSQNQQQQQRPRIRTQAEAAASIRVEASQSQTNTENSDYSNSSPPTKDKIKISSSGSSKRERRREKMHVID